MSLNITIMVFSAAILLFCGSCYRRFRLVLLGRPENRFNVVLFWSFMILLIANTEFLLHGLFPDYVRFSLLPNGAYYTLSFVFDIASVLTLLAVCIAIIRRLAFPPSYIEARSLDAFIILVLIALLMIAFFGLHASEIAQGREGAARYMPVSNFVASTFLSNIQLASLNGYINAFWWLHAIILLGFLNYLPYSKHMHILAAIPNVFFRSLVKVNTQPREEFKMTLIPVPSAAAARIIVLLLQPASC
jgi:nitrate reductase gamma subunit